MVNECTRFAERGNGPAEGRGGSGGIHRAAPAPGGANGGLQSCFAVCKARLHLTQPGVSRASRAREAAEAGEAALRFAELHGLVLSNRISFLSASPELPQTLARARGGILSAAGCAGAAPAQRSFVVDRQWDSHHGLLKTPRARGRKLLGR